MFSVFIAIIVILAIVGSIAAWINTKIILDDLAVIKKELGIKEEKRKTFLDDEFERD